MSELEITEANFHEYFYDVRKHQPARGQVMARYAAVAEFVDGGLKRDLIDMLCSHENPETVIKLMKKIGCATDRDSISIPLAMARDLNSGVPPTEVAQKPYRFVCEAFFYTKKEHIPIDDPHWSCISLKNLDEFLDAKDQRITMTGRVLTDAEKPTDLSTYQHYDPAWSDPGEESFDDSQADAGPVFDGDNPV